jgi:hypothetical protein
MKEKKVTIVAKGASQKQWSTILLELNIMKKAWGSVGVNLQATTPGLKRILSWGNKKHNESE